MTMNCAILLRQLFYIRYPLLFAVVLAGIGPVAIWPESPVVRLLANVILVHNLWQTAALTAACLTAAALFSVQARHFHQRPSLCRSASLARSGPGLRLRQVSPPQLDRLELECLADRDLAGGGLVAAADARWCIRGEPRRIQVVARTTWACITGWEDWRSGRQCSC
jgi:hypothetical protein